MVDTTVDGVDEEIAPVEQPPTLATLLGAEMLNWSDLEPAGRGRAAVGGAAAVELVGEVLTGTERVLVAGPHALEVYAAIAGRAGSVDAVDAVVRSYTDGETIAATGVTVYTGGFDRFTLDHGRADYDVVVALDGVPRLAGTDTPRLGWTEALAALKARLAPGGRLLLGAANAFGLPRLLEPVSQLAADDEWGRDTDATGAPPAGLDAIRASLGFTIETVYAVYPDPTTPAVAQTTPDPLTTAIEVGRYYAGRETLHAPYRTAYDAVASGNGMMLAPGYWFVLRDGDAVLTPPETLGTKTIRGELVEEQLLAATRADDHTRLHDVVRSYVGWLRETDPATAAQAAPDNTLTDGAAYTLLAGTDADEGTADVVVVRQLARFVERALAAGERWPWPAGGAPRSQTTRLASMAGLEIDDELWRAAGVPDEPVRPVGQAAQLATIERLTAELATTRAQVESFEFELDKLRKSRSYQVGRAIVSPLRATYGKLRSRLR